MTSSIQRARPMTVGALSRRTGVPIKTLRQYTDWGLIYTMGRSATNYRLFDADALWCVHLIGQLRGLGLTVAEICELTAGDRTRTTEPVGLRLAELLQHSRARLAARIAESQQTQRRIDEFEATHQTELAGHAGACWVGDPRCAAVLDPHRGDRPYGHDRTLIGQSNASGGTTVTSTHISKDVAELSQPGGALDLGHDPARVAIRMLRLLAQEGHPVARNRALDSITELGIDRATADALLDAWTERNTDGEIVGLGLTYHPTAHQMTIDGVQVWAWCGMDTLIFVHILDKPAFIESKAPETGDIVRLNASPDGITGLDPAGAVATQRVPGRDQVDLSTKDAIWGTFCHHNFFFPNRAQAEQWAAARGNHGTDLAILSMQDAFAAARDMAAALLRYEPEGSR